MSVRINPCYGCPIKEGCEQKAEYRRRVSGLGLRSATFRCERLKDRIKPGTRIVVTMPTFGPNNYGEDIYCGRREVKATIHSSDGMHFACVVDKSEIDDMAEREELSESADRERIRYRKTMRHSRIVRFLDEEPWRVCEFGAVVIPSGSCGNSHCSCREYGKLVLKAQMETT